jgi:hypothetical protein
VGYEVVIISSASSNAQEQSKQNPKDQIDPDELKKEFLDSPVFYDSVEEIRDLPKDQWMPFVFSSFLPVVDGLRVNIQEDEALLVGIEQQGDKPDKDASIQEVLSSIEFDPTIVNKHSSFVSTLNKLDQEGGLSIFIENYEDHYLAIVSHRESQDDQPESVAYLYFGWNGSAVNCIRYKTS